MSEEGRKTGSWIPFGSGGRMCIGYAFAQQEMKACCTWACSAFFTLSASACNRRAEVVPRVVESVKVHHVELKLS